MIAACAKHTIDIVSLKRPTALDKLAEAIPKPKGAIPNFGLPKWKVMPLESKIPMVPGPEGAYNFTRRKIGKGLWIPAEDAEFNLSDPYCYEMKLNYDSLHDKHLVPYFSRPNNIQQLIKFGLITKNLDAKCSLKDYNMYRKYLRRLHCDSIRKELNKTAKQSTEERALQYAQEQAEKEVRKLKEREKLMDRRRVIIRNRMMAEKLKLQKQREKQRKIEERLEALVQRRKEARHMQYIQSETRARLIQQKRKAATQIERKKIIQTLLEWSKKERIRKKIRETRLTQEREEKKKIVEQKWEERQEFQKKQIEKEQFLLQCIEDQHKKFIESYNEKINREAERMKRHLENIKMYIKCYMARYVPGKERRICCEKSSDDEVDETSSYMKDDKKGHEPMLIKQDKFKITQEDIKSPKSKTDKQIKQMKTNGKTKVEKERVKKERVGKERVKPARKKRPRARSKKASSVRRGGKKRRRKRRRQKKVAVDESEADVETLPESISTTKATESSDTSTSTPKDRCRCQVIKDTTKVAAAT